MFILNYLIVGIQCKFFILYHFPTEPDSATAAEHQQEPTEGRFRDRFVRFGRHQLHHPNLGQQDLQRSPKLGHW